MSDQSTNPPASQPTAGAPTTSPVFNPPPFTPPPAADLPPAGDLPAAGAAPTEPPRSSTKKTVLRKILIAVAGLVAFIAVGTIWSVATGDPTIAKAGDCLVGQDADSIKVVGCDEAKAEWKVAGEVENVRKADFDAGGDKNASCTAYPTATASYWSGAEGGKGDVLCLEPIK